MGQNLDKTKPYMTNHPVENGVAFIQDGRDFNVHGVAINLPDMKAARRVEKQPDIPLAEEVEKDPPPVEDEDLGPAPESAGNDEQAPCIDENHNGYMDMKEIRKELKRLKVPHGISWSREKLEKALKKAQAKPK
jgi:hypothetical protein